MEVDPRILFVRIEYFSRDVDAGCLDLPPRAEERLETICPQSALLNGNHFHSLTVHSCDRGSPGHVESAGIARFALVDLMDDARDVRRCYGDAR